MTPRQHPPTNSQLATSNNTISAEPAQATSGSGAPKIAARKGVLSVLRPDPHTSPGPDQERVFFGLHIVAPPDWSALTRATAICRCGTYDRQAKGRVPVLRLVEDWDFHRTNACPLRTPQGGRNAA
ncbi:hypothetical protein [Streptomyces sioyaensis]|uniref:hypothetical protein n=1 Tax=Streptomyces sioyaensis TaxID=67364 RepID=UPI003719554E